MLVYLVTDLETDPFDCAPDLQLTIFTASSEHIPPKDPIIKKCFK